MWTCPNCNQKFYNRNQQHSCGNYTVAHFLQGKPAHAIQLFEAFLARYLEIGPYELHPVKTRVALLVKMRFASINKLGDDYLDGHLVLTAPYPDDDVIYKIENLNNRFFVHHFRIHQPDDVNDALMKLMRLAYTTGMREHVKHTN